MTKTLSEVGYLGCFFSVDLESKSSVKSFSLSDVDPDRVLFEGDIGKITELSIIDARSLEIIGEKGVLRVDIDVDKLANVIESPNQSVAFNDKDEAIMDV